MRRANVTKRVSYSNKLLLIVCCLLSNSIGFIKNNLIFWLCKSRSTRHCVFCPICGKHAAASFFFFSFFCFRNFDQYTCRYLLKETSKVLGCFCFLAGHFWGSVTTAYWQTGPFWRVAVCRNWEKKERRRVAGFCLTFPLRVDWFNYLKVEKKMSVYLRERKKERKRDQFWLALVVSAGLFIATANRSLYSPPSFFLCCLSRAYRRNNNNKKKADPDGLESSTRSLC